MNLKEFYGAIGGDYDEILAGIGRESRIYKYLSRIPQQKCIEEITAALEAEKYEEAFRMAHNMKGMSANVGLDKLQAVSSDLTESLRHGPTGDVQGLLQAVEEEYTRMVELIKQIEAV